MIVNDSQLAATRKRIAWFQATIERIRQVETNPVNYEACVSGYLAELQDMERDVREFLRVHPSKLIGVN